MFILINNLTNEKRTPNDRKQKSSYLSDVKNQHGKGSKCFTFHEVSVQDKISELIDDFLIKKGMKKIKKHNCQ